MEELKKTQMVYLVRTRRKQGEDPAVDVIVEVRTTLRNIDNCVIKDGNGLKNDLKVTPRNDNVLNGSITSNQIPHETKSNATYNKTSHK